LANFKGRQSLSSKSSSHSGVAQSKEERAAEFQFAELLSGRGMARAKNHGLDTSAMMLCIATIAGVVRYVPAAP
jgi:hypothetical protein